VDLVPRQGAHGFKRRLVPLRGKAMLSHHDIKPVRRTSGAAATDGDVAVRW
jgi:hypothetical protein